MRGQQAVSNEAIGASQRRIQALGNGESVIDEACSQVTSRAIITIIN
jgi:hypothetical protein